MNNSFSTRDLSSSKRNHHFLKMVVGLPGFMYQTLGLGFVMENLLTKVALHTFFGKHICCFFFKCPAFARINSGLLRRMVIEPLEENPYGAYNPLQELAWWPSILFFLATWNTISPTCISLKISGNSRILNLTLIFWGPGRFVRSRWNLTRTIRSVDIHTHRIHVRYISLDLVDSYGEFVGRYHSHVFHLGYIKILDCTFENRSFFHQTVFRVSNCWLGSIFPGILFAKNLWKDIILKKHIAYLCQNSNAYSLVGLTVPNPVETFLQPLFDIPWVILIGIWLHKILSAMSQT